ncbi:DUF3048 domain-containing protein [Candidatus Saccharibacteria bacterium]|nr:DUF3048 domain-containing protein [Candidatus Saccharibacteria bacterium]
MGKKKVNKALEEANEAAKTEEIKEANVRETTEVKEETAKESTEVSTKGGTEVAAKESEEASVKGDAEVAAEDEPHEQSDDEVYDPKNEKKFSKVKEPLSEDEKRKKKRKKIIITVIIIVVLLLIGGGVAAYFLFFYHNEPKEEVVVEVAPEPEKPKYYSNLTGLEIANESLNNSPTFCIQVPNGMDGARPQTGLNEAAIVFEAIAEAGITRFAAIFQNPDTSVIGPIRSLRSYYLSWDTPFDCTIVHAGGSPDASREVANGVYRDMNESAVYMWRNYSSYWAPNNLMTSPGLLNEYNNALGYTSSKPAVFPRLKPEEAEKIVKENRKKAGLDQETTEETQESQEVGKEQTTEQEVVPLVRDIEMNFGYVSAFNIQYKYNEATNAYLRSYQNGQEHISYSCPAGLDQPDPKTDCGVARQLEPSVVIAMMVDEYLDTDGYHQVIQTIGSGVAYIFQNGTAEKGTWVKNSREDQITFKDSSGNIMSFTPGQMFISALPNSTGGVNY